MPRRSKVARLPETVKAELHRLLKAGASYDEITEHLKAMGANVSRSGVHRFGKKVEETARRLREASEIAAAFATELGEKPEDLSPVLVQQLRTLVFNQMNAAIGADGGGLESQDFMFLARALKDASSASKTSTELRAKLRAEAMKEAAGAAETAARRQGLSAEKIDALKAEILGLGK